MKVSVRMHTIVFAAVAAGLFSFAPSRALAIPIDLGEITLDKEAFQTRKPFRY